MPTVFENYTASFEIDKHRIELNMWDTSGELLGISCYHTTRNRVCILVCSKQNCIHLFLKNRNLPNAAVYNRALYTVSLDMNEK